MKNWKKISLACACLLFMTACSNTNTDKTEENKQEMSAEKPAEDKSKEAKDEKSESNAEKQTVYTSFYPLEYMTSEIAGDKLNVINVMPTGAEVHGWEPTAKDIADLTQAKLLIVNGLQLEGWLDNVKGELKDTKIVDTSKSIELLEADQDHDHEEGHDHEEAEEAHDHDHEHEEAEAHDHEHEHEEGHSHSHGKYDPHVWISPKEARLQIKNIYDSIVELDPANKDYYTENYKELDKKFEELDNEYEKALSAKEDRYIIVPHQAFGYLARDYGLEQVPMEGINSESEPDLNKMKELTDFAKEKKISTVFYEAGGSSKTAETLAKEIGATTAPLSTMEAKTQDVVDGKSDYFKMMQDNLESIKKSIGNE